MESELSRKYRDLKYFQYFEIFFRFSKITRLSRKFKFFKKSTKSTNRLPSQNFSSVEETYLRRYELSDPGTTLI